MIITALCGPHHFSGYKKMQLNHFALVSLWERPGAMATEPRGHRLSFSFFDLPLPKQYFYRIRVILLQRELPFKIYFV